MMAKQLQCSGYNLGQGLQKLFPSILYTSKQISSLVIHKDNFCPCFTAVVSLTVVLLFLIMFYSFQVENGGYTPNGRSRTPTTAALVSVSEVYKASLPTNI